MLRYDPTKEDHAKYLSKGKKKLGKRAEDDIHRNDESESIATPAAEVSKQQFYNVSSQLTSALRSDTTGGFSLLSMFGSAAPAESATQEPKIYKETLLKSSQKIVSDLTNPFSYDSSDDDQHFKANELVKKRKVNSSNATAALERIQKDKKGSAITVETFFMHNENDERLKGN